jgi:hypothetical protein
MENNSRLRMIAEQIDELIQLIRKINESQQQVYRIDVDLALEKVRRIYENLNHLDVQNEISIPDVKEAVKVHTEITKEEPGQEVPVEFSITKEPPEDSSSINEPVEEVVSSAKEEKVKETPVPLIDLFSTTAAEEKVTGKKTVVEKMAEQKPVEIVADKIGKKRISGLNQVIGINEKFFFINELFEGNMKEYKKAIDELDQCESYARAVECLKTLIENNGWDKSNEAYGMLLGFVERKFN